LEFNLLWDEHERKGTPFTKLTNMVSSKINRLTDAVFTSNLHQNINLRRKVVSEYAPKPLLDLVWIENILKRVPENYLCSIVSTKIATDFVYTSGIETNEIDFYNYLRELC